jgi:hypothetical protein
MGAFMHRSLQTSILIITFFTVTSSYSAEMIPSFYVPIEHQCWYQFYTPSHLRIDPYKEGLKYNHINKTEGEALASDGHPSIKAFYESLALLDKIDAQREQPLPPEVYIAQKFLEAEQASKTAREATDKIKAMRRALQQQLALNAEQQMPSASPDSSSLLTPPSPRPAAYAAAALALIHEESAPDQQQLLECALRGDPNAMMSLDTPEENAAPSPSSSAVSSPSPLPPSPEPIAPAAAAPSAQPTPVLFTEKHATNIKETLAILNHAMGIPTTAQLAAQINNGQPWSALRKTLKKQKKS